MKNLEYTNIKDILESILDCELRVKRGGKFSFPIYMTDSLYNTEIEALELSVRSINCLKRAGIHRIGELCDRVHVSSDLKMIRNCGKTSVAEIMDKLFAYQYGVLSEKMKANFLTKVVEMNMQR